MYRSYERVFTALLILAFILISAVPVSAGNPRHLGKKSPAPPQMLMAENISYNSVTLKWTASADNDKKLSTYLVYMNSVYIGRTSNTTYTAGELLSNTVYTFYVKAEDTGGSVSDSSDIIAVITPPCPASEPVPSPSPKPEPSVQGGSKIIAGYYGGWAAYSGYKPGGIDAGKLTHINYAFALIGDDLKIKMSDSYIDPKNFEELKALKAAYPYIKTLISVGGWSGSAKFSDAALTEDSRTAFAESVVEFIVKYGFDGVDIDWETPVSGGMAGNIHRSEDKVNFTLLLAKLREKLDAQGEKVGKKYLLSIAGGAGGSYVKNTELDKIAGYVDYAMIMAYDIHGPWDAYTDFNAPLYSPEESSPQYKLSADKAVAAWAAAGFPASKTLLGIPFYGYMYTGVKGGGTGLYQTFTGSSALTFDKILKTYLTDSGYIKYIHDNALVPWLYNGSTFITYDDEESVAIKAGYVNDMNLAGVSIWELSQNRGGQLLGALSERLK